MKPPRALDPETHQPWPEMTMKQKIVAWFWEREGRKLAVKLSAMILPIVAIVCGKIGVTPSGTEAIGIGLMALVPQLLDWVISRVGRKMGLVLKPLTKMIEEDEADRYSDDGKLIDVQSKPFVDPQPTVVSIPRIPRDFTGRVGANPIFSKLASLEKPEAKDIVPPGIWIVGVRDPGSPHEFRKPFGSLHSAKIYRDRCSEIYEGKGQQAESFIYEPGDEMPLTRSYV